MVFNNPDDIPGPGVDGADGAASQPDLNSLRVMLEEAAAATPPLPATPVISTVPSMITTPPPSGSSGCVPWPQCNLFFQVSSRINKTRR